MPKKPLPYAVGADFQVPLVLNAPATWTINQGADCGGTVATCSAFHYAPDDCVFGVGGLTGPDGAANPALISCWAGVIFMPSPAALVAPGIRVAPGATAIRFKARASREGARVKFGAIRPGLGETEFFIPLTTGWAEYAVSIPAGEDYDNEPMTPGGVWNGFSVVAEPQDHTGGTDIFVTDVVWTTEAAP